MKFEISLPKFKSVSKAAEKIKISHVILVSALMRVLIMSFPSEGGTIFDEAHYTKAVRAILQGLHANPEHPPLTKLIVAGFVQVFGDYWFSWRMPIIIFSLIGTYLIYLIAKEFLSEKLALVASGFVIFDIIWFIHGNIFLLEMPMITFSLAFILFYLRKRYKWSSIAFSFACLCNEKALLFGLAIIIYHLLTNINRSNIFKINKPAMKTFAVFSIIFLIVGVGGLQAVDSVLRPSRGSIVNTSIQHTVFKDGEGNILRTETLTNVETNYDYIDNAIEHALWMGQYYIGMKEVYETDEANLRPPYSWILPLGNTFNPPKYLVVSVTAGEKQYFPINYQAQIPVTIWFMTLPIICLAVYYFKEKQAKFILSWIAATYVPWVINDLPKGNETFIHYFLMTIPIVCIGIPWFWSKVGGERKNILMAIHLIATAIFFMYFFPIGFVR